MSLKSIKEYEGLRLSPYKDSLGYLTVGWGHLCHPNEKFQLGVKITLQEAEELYQKDEAIAESGAKAAVASWSSLEPLAQQILMNLVFNLGLYKFRAFKRTIGSFNAHRYSDAGDNLRDSLWYKQVGQRGKDIVQALHGLGNK